MVGMKTTASAGSKFQAGRKGTEIAVRSGICCVKELNVKTETTTADIREMMAGWSAIVARVRAAYPKASDEQIYQMAKAAMNKSLGLS